jgi:hypothetical protein
MTPGRRCALAIMAVPLIIVGTVKISDAFHLPVPDGFLNTLAPVVVGVMFLVCIWIIWRSGWSTLAKVMGTFGALLGVNAGGLIGVMFLFRGVAG